MMINHPDFCQGRNFNREQKMLKDYGFFCHMVMEDSSGMSNFHTHGIPQSLKHPDIQITIAVPTEVFGPIIHDIYDKIKNGLVLKIGIQYDQILREMPVEFIWAIENDRDVLRMILPDQRGNTSKDTIGLPYGKQWMNTFDVPQMDILEVENRT